MDEFSKKALQHHNECRGLHQVPALTWSADLAREAQEWANKIAKANTLKHASQSERKNDGENIAMFSGRFDIAAEMATGMWYNEVEKFNFKKPSFQPGTGHFTQIVWKDSKELGMARAKTPDGKSTYVVSRYRPAGNMLGNFEGNVFKSKSKDPPSFIKNSEEEQQTQVVERSSGRPGQTQTRVVVKEVRTPEGVKTVKTTTTWTTSEKIKEPSTKLKSLKISDGKNESKPVIKQYTASPQKATQSTKPAEASQNGRHAPSGSFQEQGVKLHNQYRRLHQVPDLRWSNELARDAQAWAEKIARQNTLRHATSQERNGDGENLAYFGGKFDEVAKDSVKMWYDEEKKYQYNKAGFKSGTGHFTQVVWKDSKEVGMGWAKSPDGRSAFIVGRYRPAGNMMGSFDQNVFPPKK